ncbi:MAG TPA: hypothetical protein VFZ65_05195 [Planctomycetota bacterium]|nr:hypothetical protein [Planctomycetota bacterium]
MNLVPKTLSSPLISRSVRSSLGSLSVVCLLAASARAQCSPQWLPGGGTPGTDQTVRALTVWDPEFSSTNALTLTVGTW